MADDGGVTIDDLVARGLPLARRMARACEGRGADAADLESDAVMALWRAAERYKERGFEDRTFAVWARLWIGRALRKVVRDAPFCHLAAVPIWLRDATLKCTAAAECLAARGIRRPSPHQIAGEALLDVETVEMVLEIPGVVVRQSAVEWAESKATGRVPDEPELVPAFGPQPGWSPDRDCHAICRHPIVKESPLCCMRCHESGFDHLTALRRDKATEPRPERKRVAAPRSVADHRRHETRAERRQRLFPPQHPASA